MRGGRRRPAGSRIEFVPDALANGCVGLEGSPAGGLRHHSLPLHDAEIAPRNRGVPRAQASPFHSRCTAVPGSELAGGGACHDADRHVHVQLLPDHRLHSDIWPERASLARTRQSYHYLGHGRLELSMAARYGRIVRPRGPAAAAFWLHHLSAVDRLSRAVMADRLRLVPEAARRAALAVVPLREL